MANLVVRHEGLLPRRPGAHLPARTDPAAGAHREGARRGRARVMFAMVKRKGRPDAGRGEEIEKRAVQSVAGEPVAFQPVGLGLQGLAAAVERPEERAAHRREVGQPAALLIGLDVAGPGDRRAAEHGEVDRLVVDRPDRPVGLDQELHDSAPDAGALRRIRRRGRSTSMASSDAWTRESCVATWLRVASLSRRSWAATFRTACWARETSSSSCWLLRTFSERNRSKKSQRLSTAESRNTFELPSSFVPVIRSVRWLTTAGEFLEERLLGQPDGLLEPGPDPLLLALIQIGCELDQVVGRLDRGEVEGDAEEPAQRLGVVGRVEQRAQPAGGRLLQLVEVAIEVGDGVVQLGLVVGHLAVELLDGLELDQPDARLRERQREALPVVADLGPDRRHGAEGRVLGVQQLLAGGEELALGVERLGGLGLLIRREGPLDAPPGELRRGQAAIVVRSRSAEPVVTGRFQPSAGRVSRCRCCRAMWASHLPRDE